MKKISLCIGFVGLLFVCAPVLSVGAISKTQETAISDHCDAIREDLRNVQRADARARVYVGSRYETILSKFVMPLNVWLVEKDMSRADLIESQNKISETRGKFVNEYVDYQQGLEQLVAMDCKSQPTEFYDKLIRVRQKRKKVEHHMQKMDKAFGEYKERVVKLKEAINEKTKQ